MRSTLSLRLALVALVSVLGVVCGVSAIEGVCVPYNGRLCRNFIDHHEVFVTRPVEEIEEGLTKFLAPFTASGLKGINQTCSDAYAAFVCGLYFMECKQDPRSETGYVMLPPCKQTCTDATEQCAPLRDPEAIANMPSELAGLIQSMPFSNCSGTVGNGMGVEVQLNQTHYTDDADKCVAVEKAAKPTPVCLKPLIVDPKFSSGGMSNSRFCDAGCCLPCPQSYAFYKEGALESGFLATQVLRAISAIASFIMILSYLALPGKQSHPSILILFTSIAIFLYSSNVFFSLGNPKRIQCVDEITPSTQDNNVLCGIQGALLVFAAHATTIWLAVVIFNLHMHTVWNSSVLSNNYRYVHILCWGLPTLLTIAPLVTHKIKYQFATLCLVDQSLGNELFWYPLAIVVLPSSVVHACTFVHIAKVSAETNSARTESTNSLSEFSSHKNQVIQAIRIQWRALLLALILLMCVTWYWLFYFIALGRITRVSRESNSLRDWLKCVQLGGGQNGCAADASEIVPPYGLLITSEAIVSLLGVYLLVIFSNRTLWTEWGNWISKRFRRNPRKREPTDRFYDI